MTKYKDKYRIESTRLKTRDYRNSGYYFLTILTKDRKHYLGKVIDGKLINNSFGEIVIDEWLQTKLIRNNVELDEWILMPNHFHGILIINCQENLSSNEDSLTELKSKSLGAIIGQFKSITTKRIRKEGLNEFSWQPRFYEHIIRNDTALMNIRKYIQLNPLKWEIDEYNK